MAHEFNQETEKRVKEIMGFVRAIMRASYKKMCTDENGKISSTVFAMAVREEAAQRRGAMKARAMSCE
jgi:hypothetical protein